MDAGEDIYLLDIRDAKDYAEGHLKGAVNIPYAELAANLEVIPDDKPLWINCYTGQTSSQATVLLTVAGKDAHNIQSGWLRGISKTEGFENYIDTEEATFEGSYPVDDAVKAAIEEYFASADKPFNFKPEDLKAAIEDGTAADKYCVLSVRSAEDYAKGHIPGAINVPFGKGMIGQVLTDVDPSKQIIVYCYTGQTASQVVASLRLLGLDAWNLNGGWGKATEGDVEGFGWTKDGEGNYPVEAA